MSSHLEEHYKILDVPLTATYDEIKAHYKQLVRIYHPDRFRDAGDKAYAEEKLKQINIAFHFLCDAPLGVTPSPLQEKDPTDHTVRSLAPLVIILVLGLLTMTLPPLDLFHWFDGVASTASLRPPLLQVAAGELLFTVQEKEGPVVYRWKEGDSQPNALGITGRAAVGSVAGQRVAYLDRDGEISVLDLRSGQTRTMRPDGAAKRALAWAPGGEHLAYLAGEGVQSRLMLYHVETGVQTVLPGAPLAAGVSQYGWAPDGGALLFEQWQGSERRLYAIQIDGKGLQPLTTVDSWGGAWSPDGRWLVTNTPQGIYLLDHTGTQQKQLHDTPGEQIRWSADGHWLAYQTRAQTRTTHEVQTLWVMHLASGQATVVSSESLYFAWSPTGKRLGYVTGRTATAAQEEPPLLFLWIVTPGQSAQLIAEVNDPVFHWTQ